MRANREGGSETRQRRHLRRRYLRPACSKRGNAPQYTSPGQRPGYCRANIHMRAEGPIQPSIWQRAAVMDAAVRSPLQGSGSYSACLPRALPWAIVSRPFRALGGCLRCPGLPRVALSGPSAVVGVCSLLSTTSSLTVRRHKGLLPKLVIGGRYGFPAFTLTFATEAALAQAEHAGCIDAFKKKLQVRYADSGTKESPFDAEFAVHLTLERHLPRDAAIQ
jgi:hypothetical protein